MAHNNVEDRQTDRQAERQAKTFFDMAHNNVESAFFPMLMLPNNQNSWHENGVVRSVRDAVHRFVSSN